jgi:hypothetical protein
MVKMELHFFVLFLKRILMKVFVFNNLWDFVNSVYFLLLKFDDILKIFSLEHKELLCVYLLTVSDYSVMTNGVNFRFSYYEKL